MFDLEVKDASGAGVPVPLLGRVIVFAGPDGLCVRQPDGSVSDYRGPVGVAGAVIVEHAFSASPSTEPSMGGGVYTKVQLDVATINRGGGFSVANKNYVVPAGAGGLWQVQFITTLNAVSLTNYDARVRANGVDVIAGTRCGILMGVHAGSAGAALLELQAGDVLELFTWGTASSSLRTLKGANTIFSGFRLGDA